ncbi:MAG TPA: ABC transporter permease [Clostridiaceae bacterium]|nr:ABC transporter permease [Clostridiaceae bacterium]
MKIRSVGYYFKQGLKSIARNKMMSIASVSTVMASLLILGIFFITMENVNFYMQDVEAGVEIKVFLKDDITDDEKSEIESIAKNSDGVSDVSFETKQQALENFRQQLGNNGDLVAGIDANKVMPNSYIIRMEGPQYVDGLVSKLKDIKGIDKINDARPLMDKLMKITGFIRTFGISLMVVLLIVSIFLISNTIKLTVIARRREIGIMKYIGATDWFIRWPFVIEGILLGIIGAAIAGIVLSYGYTVAVDAVAKNWAIIKLVEPEDIVPYMSVLFIVIGMVIGSMGSMVSMRKFLHV